MRKVIAKWFSLVPSEEYRNHIADAESKLALSNAQNTMLRAKLDSYEKSNPVELTKKVLGMALVQETIEELEHRSMNDAQFWETSAIFMKHPVFLAILQIVKLTFRDKIARESTGRDADMLNRGAIIGAQHIADTMLRLATMKPQQAEKPLEGMDRFKTM